MKLDCQRLSIISLKNRVIFFLLFFFFASDYIYNTNNTKLSLYCISSLLFSDSQYGDVSGLPDPFSSHDNMVDHSGKPIQNQHPMQHMTFEESLGESGYSTPNSRSRRIIREIIVWKWNAASDFLMDKTTHSHLLKEFYFKNSDEDVKKLPFLIWKMLKNLWSPYFLVWLKKK